MRVDLPNEQWAELHSPEEMPRRVSARLEDMLAEIPEDQPRLKYVRDMGRMRDTLIAMVIKGWSYDSTRSGEREDLLELPDAAYKTLVEATEPHWEAAGFTSGRTAETEPKSESSTSSA